MVTHLPADHIKFPKPALLPLYLLMLWCTGVFLHCLQGVSCEWEILLAVFLHYSSLKFHMSLLTSPCIIMVYLYLCDITYFIPYAHQIDKPKHLPSGLPFYYGFQILIHLWVYFILFFQWSFVDKILTHKSYIWFKWIHLTTSKFITSLWFL